jgi:tRNA(Ile)-lysidine synthase
MHGHAARLAADERRRLDTLPPMVRRSLPVLLETPPTCPLFNTDAGVRARSIVGERLRAASGLIDREGA